MGYPEQRYTVYGAAVDYPAYDSVTGTLLLAKNSDGNFGYISASNLQTTLDGAGLATDADITSLSGSVATKMKNTGFLYITGSASAAWNDASASAAGVAVGQMYHSQGTVKVRLS